MDPWLETEWLEDGRAETREECRSLAEAGGRRSAPPGKLGMDQGPCRTRGERARRRTCPSRGQAHPRRQEPRRADPASIGSYLNRAHGPTLLQPLRRNPFGKLLQERWLR